MGKIELFQLNLNRGTDLVSETVCLYLTNLDVVQQSPVGFERSVVSYSNIKLLIFLFLIYLLHNDLSSICKLYT